MSEAFVWDAERQDRLGFDEAIFCAGKTAEQIAQIVEQARAAGRGLLLTRLDAVKVTSEHAALLDYDPLSRTAYLGSVPEPGCGGEVVVITAGTSDMAVAEEARRTLAYYGRASTLVADVGVAALWRISARLEEIRGHRLAIVVAGMDAALPSVLGGLFKGPVIAVPTSVGYGVAEGGRTALDSVLASCAPGVTVCNIDNGYGAACAALRILGAKP